LSDGDDEDEFGDKVFGLEPRISKLPFFLESNEKSNISREGGSSGFKATQNNQFSLSQASSSIIDGTPPTLDKSPLKRTLEWNDYHEPVWENNLQNIASLTPPKIARFVLPANAKSPKLMYVGSLEIKKFVMIICSTYYFG
jgi:hypothetical protein